MFTPNPVSAILRRRNQDESDSYPRSWVAVYSIDGQLSAVRVVYSDETEMTAGLNGVVVVAAAMLNLDTQWGSLLLDWGNLPESWRKRREIKGHRLLRDLRVDRGPDSASALRAICQIPVARGIPVFCDAIDRAGWDSWQADLAEAFGSKRYDDIHTTAFHGCLVKVDSYLETLLSREKVVWIADASEYQSLAKESLKRHQSWMADEMRVRAGVSLGTLPERRFVSHVTDTIYFGDSHESLALQLADVCCSVIAGHLLSDPVAEPYYEMIEPQLVGGEPKVDHKGRKRYDERFKRDEPK